MMDVEQMVSEIQPLQGEVVPIRTVQETQPVEEFGMTAMYSDCITCGNRLTWISDDAYVAEVNVKAASKVIK